MELRNARTFAGIYLEDYLIAPYAVYEERGRGIEARLPEWGHSLFESLFGAGKPGHDAYLKSREGSAELVTGVFEPAVQRLAGIGLVTALGAGMYGLHPALPSYLMAEWRRMAGVGLASEHAAAERALLTAYGAFGFWGSTEIQEGGRTPRMR